MKKVRSACAASEADWAAQDNRQRSYAKTSMSHVQVSQRQEGRSPGEKIREGMRRPCFSSRCLVLRMSLSFWEVSRSGKQCIFCTAYHLVQGPCLAPACVPPALCRAGFQPVIVLKIIISSFRARFGKQTQGNF